MDGHVLIAMGHVTNSLKGLHGEVTGGFTSRKKFADLSFDHGVDTIPSKASEATLTFKKVSSGNGTALLVGINKAKFEGDDQKLYTLSNSGGYVKVDPSQ